VANDAVPDQPFRRRSPERAISHQIRAPSHVEGRYPAAHLPRRSLPSFIGMSEPNSRLDLFAAKTRRQRRTASLRASTRTKRSETSNAHIDDLHARTASAHLDHRQGRTAATGSHSFLVD